MSKKKLLEESTVRKFMKFANLGHLAESFVDEAMYEDDMEADMLPPEAGEEFAGDEEEPMEEPAAEEGNEELLARVVQAVADELGVEAEVEGAGEEMGMEDEEMGMEDEEELEGGDDFAPTGEEPLEDDEAIMEVIDEDAIDEDAIIEEVMRRVIERVAAKK
jgi:hypothetical protein